MKYIFAYYRFPVFLFLLITGISIGGCSDDDKDDLYPVIDMTGESAFPVNCSVVHPGESFKFRAVFTDNRELGAFSIEMHNNFDHHTHSTDVVNCEMEDDKNPQDPFKLIGEWDISAGIDYYEADVEIFVPAGKDTGDYHFMVRLTDASGWQTLKGISMKIQAKE